MTYINSFPWVSVLFTIDARLLCDISIQFSHDKFHDNDYCKGKETTQRKETIERNCSCKM